MKGAQPLIIILVVVLLVSLELLVIRIRKHFLIAKAKVEVRSCLNSKAAYTKGYVFAFKFEPNSPVRLSTLLTFVEAARSCSNYTEFEHGIEDYVRTARKLQALETGERK